MLGLAAVLHTSALGFAALKWCGLAYLAHMSWQALREQCALVVDTRCALKPTGDRYRFPDQHP
jgi:threonine/homoserine/homoserine lactone efflux protein